MRIFLKNGWFSLLFCRGFERVKSLGQKFFILRFDLFIERRFYLPFRYQLFEIQSTYRFFGTDESILERLRIGGLISFIMAVFAVAAQIDEDIALKSLADLDRQFCGK